MFLHYTALTSLFVAHIFQCKLGHILQDDSFSGHLRSFFATVRGSLMYIFEHSYVSLVGALLLLIAAIAFVPSKVSRKKRGFIGILHVLAHLSAALILMLLLELGVETCIRHKLLATSGDDIDSVLCSLTHLFIGFFFF